MIYKLPKLLPKIKLGEACVFAVTKDLSRRWEDKAITDPKGGCDEQGDYLPSYYVTCEAARLIKKDTVTLHKKFNLYSFFIKKEDLNGPLEETSESGSSEYYEVQKNSLITIYKYNEGRWKEIGKGVNSDIPRVFGEEYMENLVSGKTKNP